MAVTSFIATQWQPMDIIDETKMSEMSNSLQYVYDNTPRAKFNHGGKSATSGGVRILSGRKVVPAAPRQFKKTVQVKFGKFFSPGCRPIVTTGIMSNGQQNIFVTFRGQNDINQPDSNGMAVDIEVSDKDGKEGKIRSTFSIHYIAVGY